MIPFYENKSKSIYISECNGLTFPAHLHNAIECIYIESGEIEITIESKPYSLKQGEMAIMFPNIVHSYISDSNNDNKYKLFIFPVKINSKLYSIINDKKPSYPIIHKNKIHYDIPKNINEILNLSKIEKPNELLIETLVQLILIRLLDNLDLVKNDTKNSDNIIEKAVIYITNNFKNNLSLEDIAKHIGVNKYYLSRILKNALNMGLCEYINNLRIDYAKTLLLSTNLSVSETAIESGYDSLRTFNRCFKEIVNYTPKEYRSINTLK